MRMVDRAYEVLITRGSVITYSELRKSIGIKLRSVSRLKSQMVEDSRFECGSGSVKASDLEDFLARLES